MSGAGMDACVELTVPAVRSMMLVLRLTTAGVVARAGLGVDRMEDVKLAVEEACACLIGEDGGPDRLQLRFDRREDALDITMRGAGGGCVHVDDDEREVVRCILESLAGGVELRQDGDAILEIRLRVALNA